MHTQLRRVHTPKSSAVEYDTVTGQIIACNIVHAEKIFVFNELENVE